MTFQITTRRVVLALALLLLAALYLADLGGMGLISKDEPRYADIGRAMARTGDWITPKLWGQPWFEKPPLLYWLIALGFRAGFGPELAPRLPVAMLSFGFLIFFRRKTRALYDERTADFATAMLATSGGWLAFSHVAVTDIPLAVTFSMAVLFALERRITAAAAALGFAVLAKSLVPLVLFVPVLALDYRRWREWLRPAPLFAFFCVALPWHILCWVKNGNEFPNVLFIQQQFGRFHSAAIGHPQPVWFYLPVLLLLLFPWFPALTTMAWERIPAAIVIWGFLFFSASVNKLPGYLLPLIPAFCLLVGKRAAHSYRSHFSAAASFALLALVPVAAAILPTAMKSGATAALRDFHATSVLLFAAMAIAGGIGIRVFRRQALPITFFCAAAAMLGLQFAAFPAIGEAVSARTFWQREHPSCVDRAIDRGMLYGLNYYAGHALPECAVLDQSGGRVVR